MKKSFFIFLISLVFLGSAIYAEEIEEIVVTGTLLKDIETDSSPVDQITSEDFDKLNVNNIAEISKYLNTTAGSHFQTNALEGVDQGMANITLRGLDHASTLLLINSKRHTFAGTPSNEGEGYIDANIIPEIAFEKIEILKEGATSIYGSDAVADWPILNAMLSISGGSSWTSLHHGGGVGMGFSQHSGVVIVADGTDEAEQRLARVLWNDPATGVMRHADAGYDIAKNCAQQQNLDLPMLNKDKS